VRVPSAKTGGPIPRITAVNLQGKLSMATVVGGLTQDQGWLADMSVDRRGRWASLWGVFRGYLLAKTRMEIKLGLRWRRLAQGKKKKS